MIEAKLKRLIENSLILCKKKGELSIPKELQVTLETPKFKEHGDYATNIAMILAPLEKKKPRDVAKIIIENIPEAKEIVNKVEVAGPGFINFHLNPNAYFLMLSEIIKAGDKFGASDIGRGKRVQVEFVSANPTGPLHVGHGRGAIFGDVLASVLKAAGYDVLREYYLNDTGVQIRTLGRSLYLRMKEMWGEDVTFPEDCYQGDYIKDMAKGLLSTKKGDKIKKMDEGEAILFLGKYAADIILEEIKEDLKLCGVTHDTYFSEIKLHKDKAIDKAIALLSGHGKVYESEGAIWFKSTDYGDEKDRVLKKGSGDYTYFASDVAYHEEKFKRGFDLVIDIWGADHAGHIVRMKGAIEAMGFDPNALQVILVQLVSLVKGGELISMSTRRARYETLRTLIDEVGRDVLRYFFLMRSHNAQLDFDLKLAKKETPENPVYYIQYAHARISSVFEKAKSLGKRVDLNKIDLSHLDLEEEIKLAKFLFEYPKVILECATTLEPHKLSFYLLELAKIFQAYYTKGRHDQGYKMISEDPIRMNTKLYLLKCIQIVLKNGLEILGISAPLRMIRED